MCYIGLMLLQQLLQFMRCITVMNKCRYRFYFLQGRSLSQVHTLCKKSFISIRQIFFVLHAEADHFMAFAAQQLCGVEINHICTATPVMSAIDL